MNNDVDKYKNYSDEELVGFSLKDVNYFATLFYRYQEPLLRYIRRILGWTSEHSEEVLQEVFIKVWKNLKGFDTNLKFSSWIYRITHNECVSLWKKEKKHSSNVSFDELEWNLSNTYKDNIEEINFNLDKHTLSEVLLKLDIKYREVIILRYWEEKDYDEISEIIKKPKNTVGTLLSRAKKELKNIVESDSKLHHLIVGGKYG